jgi:CRP-like cAMP-binding protein
MQAAPDQLRVAGIFDRVSDEDLERVAKWTELRSVDENERVVREGASGFFFYVIVDGSVSVRHGDTEIAKLGTGDHFGEMVFQGSGRRQADVVATAPTTLGVMFGTDFLEMERELPEVAAKIRVDAEARGAP